MAIQWYLQLVHYPMLDQIGKNEFQDYNRLIGPWRRGIVYVPSVGAFLFSLLVITSPPWKVWLEGVYAVIGLNALMLALSILVNRPMHYILTTHGYSNKTIRRLTRFQWLRTLGWTLSAAIAIMVVLKMMKI